MREETKLDTTNRHRELQNKTGNRQRHLPNLDSKVYWNKLNFVFLLPEILLFPQELYKTTEELEEKKADKHMVENEIVSVLILTAYINTHSAQKWLACMNIASVLHCQTQCYWYTSPPSGSVKVLLSSVQRLPSGYKCKCKNLHAVSVKLTIHRVFFLYCYYHH